MAYQSSMVHDQGIGAMRSVLVTNTRSYSGSSHVAVDLAEMIAESGYKAALVDANLRRPSIHTVFNLPKAPGLSDILLNHRTALSALQATEHAKLAFLSGGKPAENGFDLIRSQKMRESLALLMDNFDRVIIYGPPFFHTEAAQLACLVDGVILLIHPGHNRSETSRAIMDKFQRSGAKIMGIVMREQSRHQGSQSAFIDRLLSFDKHTRQFA